MNKETTKESLIPHPVLTDYYKDESAREKRIKRLFDDTAKHYDAINSVMSLGNGEKYRKEALERAGLSKGQFVLDIGCGTGVLARHEMDIVESEGFVIGVDPSPGMLKEAVGRGVNRVALGRGESLPLLDNSVDFVSMGYALRHVADLTATFNEYYRALKPGGTLLLLEMAIPESRIRFLMLKAYMCYYVPFMARIRSGGYKESQVLMQYYWDTMVNFVPYQSILDSLEESGFKHVRRNVVHGIFGEFTATKEA